MFCLHCGNRLPDTARFCNKCGVRQVSPPSQFQGGAPLIVRSSGPTTNPEMYPPNVMKSPVQPPGHPAAPYPAH